MFLTRRKSIDTLLDHAEHHQLRKTLSWPHLVALGVGAIVGTGIYTLIGVGAGLAGPAVILSFVIAGAVCACAALAYAEMSTMMPAAGSSYTYSYAVLGEGLAWIVGWSLILEYTLVVSTVVVGWSGYAVGFLKGVGIELPAALATGPHAGGLVNVPAIAITWVVAGALIAGTRESATVNAFLVVAKLLALAVFVAIALPLFFTERVKRVFPSAWVTSVASKARLSWLSITASTPRDSVVTAPPAEFWNGSGMSTFCWLGHSSAAPTSVASAMAISRPTTTLAATGPSGAGPDG